jgi:protein TonB
MPEMALCDYLKNPSERKECMTEHIIKIIYGNLKWPPLARESCVEGMAVISFAVTETGVLEDFKIVRDPGAGTGEEALRVVKLLAEETGPWHPGTVGPDRKPVRVQYNMPVKFKLR